MAKELYYGEEARRKLQAGVEPACKYSKNYTWT